jgi:hypothetical protein
VIVNAKFDTAVALCSTKCQRTPPTRWHDRAMRRRHALSPMMGRRHRRAGYDRRSGMARAAQRPPAAEEADHRTAYSFPGRWPAGRGIDAAGTRGKQCRRGDDQSAARRRRRRAADPEGRHDGGDDRDLGARPARLRRRRLGGDAGTERTRSGR